MIYDIVIIGAGPAGLSAAVYGQRAGKKTLLIDVRGFGGQILNTPEVENYPGIKKVSGFEFASGLYEQASGQGAEIVYEKAVGIEAGNPMVVRTETGSYEARAVILATGAKNRPLGIPTEEKLKLISEAFSDIDEYVLNLFKIICERKLVHTFPEIYKTFVELKEEAYGIIRVECESCIELSKKQTEGIIKKLESATGKTVILKNIVRKIITK